MRCFAILALLFPISSKLYKICLFKLDISTTSNSTAFISPIPKPAKSYIMWDPNPPNPIIPIFESINFFWEIYLFSLKVA